MEFKDKKLNYISIGNVTISKTKDNDFIRIFYNDYKNCIIEITFSKKEFEKIVKYYKRLK